MAITLTTSPQVVGSNSDGGFRVELLAWYTNKSGNSAIVHVKERVTFIDGNYTHYYGTNKSYTLNFNGTSSSQYADTMYLNTPIDMAERTQTMSGGSSISASASWYSYNYGTVNCALSDTVKLPSFGPTGLVCLVTGTTAESVTGTVSVSSFGTSGTDSYLEIGLWTYSVSGLTEPKRWTGARTGSQSILSGSRTVTNSSSGDLVIVGNTRYVVSAEASNGTDSTGKQRIGSVITKPYTPTVSVGATTATTAVINYSVPADGGFYDKTIEYSLDGGSTWNTAATVSGGGATSSTFTITGLTTGEHTISVRSRTSAGSSSNVVVSWESAAVRLIASDKTIGREVTALLVPVGGTATETTRLLVSHNGVATENE